MIVPHGDRGVTKVVGSRRVWNDPPQMVIAQYAKLATLPYRPPEYDRTREIRLEATGTTP